MISWFIYNIYNDFIAGEGSIGACELDLPSVVDVLTQYIMHNSVQTKVAVLRWIHDLYIKIPTKVSIIFHFFRYHKCYIICDQLLSGISNEHYKTTSQLFTVKSKICL